MRRVLAEKMPDLALAARPPFRAHLTLPNTGRTITIYSYRVEDLIVAMGAMNRCFHNICAVRLEKRDRNTWIETTGDEDA